MRALIDPRYGRIAEVAEQDFEIAPPLFWIDCEVDVVADKQTWDGKQISAPQSKEMT